ncbi:MAG TPA: hypothetical protein VJ868_10420 [Actinomycetota bacterium]|nr:hypothetical protein [Actinomycetota bacterium]
MSRVPASALPPPRAVAPARREARWLPPIVVVLVMIAVIVGGYPISEAVGPRARPSSRDGSGWGRSC